VEGLEILARAPGVKADRGVRGRRVEGMRDRVVGRRDRDQGPEARGELVVGEAGADRSRWSLK
jgi:hypothetical protein